MNKLWHDEAWEDYLYWQTQDKKTLKRTHRPHHLKSLIDQGFFYIYKNHKTALFTALRYTNIMKLFAWLSRLKCMKALGLKQ